jgi:predicted DsbA family dithiol-disulfide isomerase
MLVEIWSDVVCPWCYIGKRRFEAALARFEHRGEVALRWRSFELDPDAPARRTEGAAEHVAAKYQMTLEEARAQLARVDALATAEGLDYDLARTNGGNSFAAHRLIHLGYATDAATGAAMKEALLRAHFVERRPIGDAAVLAELAVAVGLARREVDQVLSSDRFADEVRRDEAEAASLGCQGVPFFVFDRAYAVPGAQDVETFLATLRRAWERAHPVMDVIAEPGASACAEGSCAL